MLKLQRSILIENISILSVWTDPEGSNSLDILKHKKILDIQNRFARANYKHLQYHDFYINLSLLVCLESTKNFKIV